MSDRITAYSENGLILYIGYWNNLDEIEDILSSLFKLEKYGFYWKIKHISLEISNKILKVSRMPICNICDSYIRECDWCGYRFRDGDQVICVELEGERLHFCCQECLMYWIDNENLIGMVRGDSNGE